MIVDRIIDAFAVLAGVLLCTLTLLICVDVASRTFELFSIVWTTEITEYHLYAITFMGAPWVLRMGGHIAVDLLVTNLSERAAVRVSWLAHLICAIICVVLLYYSIATLWSSVKLGTLVYKSIVFPEWYQYVLPPFTFLLMLIIFVRWLIHPPKRTGEKLDEGL